MKKNKLKHLLKCGILLFGISFAVISCQDESLDKEVINLNVPTSEYHYFRTNPSHLYRENNALRERIINKLPKKKTQNSLRVDSDEYGFSIDTSFIQVISSDNLNSYTFIIERENPNPDILENYVYTEFSNGGFTQLITTYPIIETNDGITYDMENAFAQYIEDDALIVGRSGGCGSFSEEIYSWVETCVDYNCTAGGDHTYGQTTCQGDSNEQPYQVCNWGWAVTGCVQFIDEFGGGSGNSGAGDGGTNNNDTNDDETEEEPPETPLIPFGTKKECKKVNKILNDVENINFKQKLNELANPSNYSQNLDIDFEKYGGLHENENNLQEKQGDTTDASVDILYAFNHPNKIKSFVHTHPNLTGGTYSIFSFEDLIAISKLLEEDKLNTGTFVAFLITKKGSVTTNYALTIDNKTKFKDFFYAYQNFNFSNASQEEKDKRTNSWNKSRKLRDEYYDSKTPKINIVNSNSELMLTEFLKLMNEADMGVSLFEASPSLNNEISTYNSISLDGNTVKRKPCNN